MMKISLFVCMMVMMTGFCSCRKLLQNPNIVDANTLTTPLGQAVTNNLSSVMPSGMSDFSNIFTAGFQAAMNILGQNANIYQSNLLNPGLFGGK